MCETLLLILSMPFRYLFALRLSPRKSTRFLSLTFGMDLKVRPKLALQQS